VRAVSETDTQTLTPALFYRDPKAAMSFLERAFGFETVMVIEDPDGGPSFHGEMRLGGSSVRIGAEWSADHASPASLNGKNTQTLAIQVETDVDAHCAQARAAGADIFAEPETQFYGDRTYRCRDPEGHIWVVAQTVEVVTREQAEAASGLTITGWS
jgi:uncharacterized glyoxalase superfamily protein PhnB